MHFSVLTLAVLSLQSSGLCSQDYVSALYYSEWSFPNHVPAQIPMSHVTNIYFAFFDIDKGKKNIKLSNELLDLSSEIDFNTTCLREDCDDLTYFNVSDNVNSEYYKSLPWLDGYLDAAKSLVGSESGIKSQGIVGQMHQLRALNSRLKISMSIGGANTAKSFSSVTVTKKSTKQFVANIVANVNALGFDGVDIDWEFPSSDHDTKMLTYMLELLKYKLSHTGEGREKIISLAIPLDLDTLKHFDFRMLDQYVDYYNLMGYDISGTWSHVAGFQSQLYPDKNIAGSTISVDNTVKYLEPLVNKSKILLGMPAYGVSFNADNLYKNFNDCAPIEDKNITDNQDKDDKCIIDYIHLPPKGYVEVSDTEIGAAYAHSAPGQPEGIVVYDTPAISRLKAQYVEKNGLGGGMWWDSKGDTLISNATRSLVYNFVDELGGIYKLSNQMVPFNYNGTLENGIVSTEVHDGDFESNLSSRTAANLTLTYYALFLYCFILVV